MATVLKLSIFDFCDFWIATSDLCTALIFFTLPGPVRSAAKVCSCAYVIGLDQWFPASGSRAKSAHASESGPPDLKKWPSTS